MPNIATLEPNGPEAAAYESKLVESCTLASGERIRVYDGRPAREKAVELLRADPHRLAIGMRLVRSKRGTLYGVACAVEGPALRPPHVERMALAARRGGAYLLSPSEPCAAVLTPSGWSVLATPETERGVTTEAPEEAREDTEGIALADRSMRDLKPMAQAAAKERGVSSAWIATASKAAVVAFLEGGEAPGGPAIVSKGGDAVAEALAALQSALAKPAGVDADAVNAILAPLAARVDALEEREAPRPILVAGRPAPEAKPGERTHRDLEKVLEAFLDHRNVLIYGPAGSGKTSLFVQAAARLGVPFGSVSCTAGMSESHILGRMTPDGVYLPSEFVRRYEGPGLFLFDEYDAADANVTLITNQATANGHLPVPVRPSEPYATRHAEAYIGLAGNTRGDSYGGAYAGRSRQDMAFLDRFTGAVFEVGYDVELEASIIAGLPPQVPAALWRMRANVEKAGLERVVSTRAFAAAARMAHRFDLSGPKGRRALVDRMLTLWSAEDRAVAMEGVAL